MNAKKFISLLALVCSLGVMACGGDNNSSSSKKASSSSPVVSTPAPSTSSSLTSSSINNDDIYDSVKYVREELGEGEVAIIKGVVVKHNYTGQSTPYITGFWLADKTGSIYIYGEEVAKSVEVGNTVVVKGAKAYYIPQNDQGAAASVNYKGMLQLTLPEILENDHLTTGTPSTSAITFTTVKDILEIPLTEDITGQIFCVKGRWSKVTPADFTNYYLYDLNRVDSIMAYTQSNGKDYSWTDAYDGKTVEMFITYEPQFTQLGEWFKQLFGESEGKEGKGLLPTSATFSTDLHSLGQFIQEGTPLLFETIFVVDTPNHDVTINADQNDLDGLNYLAGKKLSYVNQKAFEGTLSAHVEEGKIPNIVLSLPKMDEYNLGYLFFFFMKACAMSAYLLNINPFNQPGVEVYKKRMFKLLGKPGVK